MKQYRPHIFVVIALAIVLSCGWHGALRHALADLRFGWQTRQASGDIVVVAIDAPSIDKIGVWPWPRRLHAELIRQLQKARRAGHRARCRFQHAVGRGVGPDVCRGAAKRRRLGRAAVVPAARHRPDGAARQPPAAAIHRSFLAGARQCRGRLRRPGPPLPVRREARRQFLPSMAAVLAGQYAENARAVPDRFQHPHRGDPESLLCRRAARRRGDAAETEGQEGHHRRHRARTRRPLQRSERRHRVRAGAADAGRRIAAAEPRAAMDFRASSRWPGCACSR